MSLFSAQVLVAQESNFELELQRCSQVNADSLRLTCFDKLVVELSSATGIEKDKVVNSETSSVKITTENVVSAQEVNEVPVVTKQQVDDFAKHQVEKTEEEKLGQITEITASITKLKKLIRGEYQITLDNEQLWQQKGDTKISLKVGQRVVLTKGSLGAVYLKKESTNKRIRVRRLQ